MVHLYNGLLFGGKEGFGPDSHHYLAESQKHYAKWQEPDTNDLMLCDSIYTKCPEKANPQRQRGGEWCLGLAGEGDDCKCIGGVLGGEISRHRIMMVVSELGKFTKTH